MTNSDRINKLLSLRENMISYLQEAYEQLLKYEEYANEEYIPNMYSDQPEAQIAKIKYKYASNIAKVATAIGELQNKIIELL